MSAVVVPTITFIYKQRFCISIKNEKSTAKTTKNIFIFYRTIQIINTKRNRTEFIQYNTLLMWISFSSNSYILLWLCSWLLLSIQWRCFITHPPQKRYKTNINHSTTSIIHYNANLRSYSISPSEFSESKQSSNSISTWSSVNFSPESIETNKQKCACVLLKCANLALLANGVTRPITSCHSLLCRTTWDTLRSLRNSLDLWFLFLVDWKSVGILRMKWIFHLQQSY